jgi:hypothetical protein
VAGDPVPSGRYIFERCIETEIVLTNNHGPESPQVHLHATCDQRSMGELSVPAALVPAELRAWLVHGDDPRRDRHLAKQSVRCRRRRLSVLLVGVRRRAARPPELRRVEHLT